MILSFDPGVSTGVAVLTENGNVSETLVIRTTEDLDKFCTGFTQSSLWALDEIDVVVEEGPKGTTNYRPHIQEVEEMLKKHFPNITWVPPGQWKGHPASKPTHELKSLTQHEKDAVGLGRWFRKTKLGRETT